MMAEKKKREDRPHESAIRIEERERERDQAIWSFSANSQRNDDDGRELFSTLVPGEEEEEKKTADRHARRG